MLIKVFNKIVLNNLSQHQNNLNFSDRQITKLFKLFTSNVCHLIINIFSYGFSVMKNIFVKWASGGLGFRIEVTLRADYGYRAGYTGSWVVRANQISAHAISISHFHLRSADSEFLGSYSASAWFESFDS